MNPVLTDRHGFLLYKGNQVRKVEDNSRFVVSEVLAMGTSPVVYLLKDGNGGVVDASLVMLTEEEKNMNSWKRATFSKCALTISSVVLPGFSRRLITPK